MVKKNYDDMLSHFHLIPERHGQTDGQTDRFAISISRVSVIKTELSDVIQKNQQQFIGNK